MENWQLVLATMAALIAGATIPLLFQLRATLREINTKVVNVERALQPTLEDARIAMHRIRLVTDAVEGNEEDFGRTFNEVMHSASDLANTLHGLGNSAKVATAVGSAVAAGVRAFREPPREGPAPSPHPEDQQGSQAAPFYPKPSPEAPSVNLREVS